MVRPQIQRHPEKKMRIRTVFVLALGDLLSEGFISGWPLMMEVCMMDGMMVQGEIGLSSR